MNNDIRYIELAKACGVYGTDHLGDLLEFAYSVAADEREACAKLVEDMASRIHGYDKHEYAEAIRTKGGEK